MSEYRVELESPSGRTVVSTSPAETVELVYGRGYRDPGGKQPAEVTDVDYKTPRQSKAKSTKATTDSPDEGTP